jgi:hypothetical protein
VRAAPVDGLVEVHGSSRQGPQASAGGAKRNPAGVARPGPLA